MKVVYIDLLFIINVLVNFLLLSMTAKLSAAYTKKIRLWLGAVLGGLFSVFLFFAPTGLLYSTLYKVFLCCGVVSLTFGKRPLSDFLRLCIIFCLVTFAMGGVVFALTTLGLVYGSVSNGILYFDLSLGKLLLGGMLTYGVLTLIIGRGGLPKQDELVEIRADLSGAMLVFSAMTDTGNCLTEPLTGKKVILVSPDILSGFVPADISDWTTLHPYIIPYQTAAGFGCIYSFRPDHLFVNGKERKDYLLGVSPRKINGKQSTGAIIGGVF